MSDRPRSVVIMAGGLATRLGPLAQGSKALVTVGGKPMIAHHLALARAIGAQRVVMVVPPHAYTLQAAVRHMTAGYDVQVHFVEQHRPTGPADAFLIGLRGVEWDHDALVLMADTYIEVEDVRRMMAVGGSRCAVAPAPALGRSWCFRAADDSYVDQVVLEDRDVCIGAYWITQHKSARLVLVNSGMAEDDGGMAPLLTRLDLDTVKVTSWLDTGDLAALARARRTMFTRRAHHSVGLDYTGRLYKEGPVADEANGWKTIQMLWPNLIPHVYRAVENSIVVDFVDQPSLAELLLYWDIPAAQWTYILECTVAALAEGPWSVICEDARRAVQRAAYEMYIEKTRKRSHGWTPSSTFTKLLQVAEDELIDTVIPGYIHGDPNFTNILFSLSTGVPKFIDPRGVWGNLAPCVGDVRYDLAKLRYSYRDNFAAISRDEFDADGNVGPTVSEHLGDLLDRVIEAHSPEGVLTRELDIIQALLLYSAVPLHSPAQQPMLRAAAEARAERVL